MLNFELTVEKKICFQDWSQKLFWDSWMIGCPLQTLSLLFENAIYIYGDFKDHLFVFIFLSSGLITARFFLSSFFFVPCNFFLQFPWNQIMNPLCRKRDWFPQTPIYDPSTLISYQNKNVWLQLNSTLQVCKALKLVTDKVNSLSPVTNITHFLPRFSFLSLWNPMFTKIFQISLPTFQKTHDTFITKN